VAGPEHVLVNDCSSVPRACLVRPPLLSTGAGLPLDKTNEHSYITTVDSSRKGESDA
jgi:hypothetical protein